jgi:outer membrane protein
MKKLLAIASFGVLTCIAAPAFSAEKIGVVNLQQVVSKSAYSQRLRSEIEAELTPVLAELRTLSAQVTQMRQKLEKDGLTMGKSQRKKLEKEIRTKIFEAKVREGSFKEESQYREKEALDKVSKTALQAIAKIAKAESYDLIVHNEAVLYAVEAIDLTEQVAKELK